MSQRILTAALFGLAIASHGVLAQDMGTTGGDRNAQPEQQTSDQKQDEQKREEQRRLEEYWATHNDDAPGYPFNP